MSNISDKEIVEYYALIDQEAILPKNIFDAIGAFFKRENGIIISNKKLFRGIAKLYGMRRNKLDIIIPQVEYHFAMIDALKVLAKKNVPVFFYNRVGFKKDGFRYCNMAKERIDKGLNFPKMAIDYELYEGHFKELLGKDYSTHYIECLQAIPQIVKKRNLYSHQDCAGELVNIVNGHRITISTPEHPIRRIHIYGRCGVFGYAVADEQTLPSEIQKLVSDKSIEVINHGLWGGEDRYILHNFFNELAGYGENDIVLFYMKHFDKRLQSVYEKLGMHYHEITEDWHRFPEAKWCFYDKPGHMNAVGYKNAASLIVADLLKHNFQIKTIDTEEVLSLDARYLNSYLKDHKDNSFIEDVDKYVKQIVADYPVTNGNIFGSIVMNCNPFTYGHRYLVEYAAKMVDRLYIFVVEEDKSYFKFKDRFEMVKNGTKDIQNVVVVPSGNFIISALTFPEYFLKDYVKEKNFDVSQDLETFCSLIAKPLNISIRFAGEEPFDPVTENYNENMAKILPKYGMKFEEIPRKTVDGSNEVINATKVRVLLKEKDLDELQKFIPETTLKIICERYLED